MFFPGHPGRGKPPSQIKNRGRKCRHKLHGNINYMFETRHDPITIKCGHGGAFERWQFRRRKTSASEDACASLVTVNLERSCRVLGLIERGRTVNLSRFVGESVREAECELVLLDNSDWNGSSVKPRDKVISSSACLSSAGRPCPLLRDEERKATSGSTSTQLDHQLHLGHRR